MINDLIFAFVMGIAIGIISNYFDMTRVENIEFVIISLFSYHVGKFINPIETYE